MNTTFSNMAISTTYGHISPILLGMAEGRLLRAPPRALSESGRQDRHRGWQRQGKAWALGGRWQSDDELLSD